MECVFYLYPCFIKKEEKNIGKKPNCFFAFGRVSRLEKLRLITGKKTRYGQKKLGSNAAQKTTLKRVKTKFSLVDFLNFIFVCVRFLFSSNVDRFTFAMERKKRSTFNQKRSKSKSHIFARLTNAHFSFSFLGEIGL
jgi:hypothetical protein